MKKHIIFLIILIIISLAGCNGSESDHKNSRRTTKDSETDIFLKIEQHDAPSELVVIKDLENVLLEKENNLELTGAETVKSLTEEDTFQITIKATAQNNYADCVCELDLFYSKYDQGWLIDDAHWNYAEYEQKRIPQPDQMKDHALKYITENSICADAPYYDFMIKMEEPELEFGFAEKLNANALIFKWKAVKHMPYTTQQYIFQSYWQYEPEIDNWILCEDSSSFYDVHITHDAGPIIPNSTADFSGTWKDDMFKTQIQIDAFTWDGFDATITWNEKASNGEIVRKSYSDTFKKSDNYSSFPNPIPNSDYVFVSESGRQCVAFFFYDYIMITAVVQYNNNGNQEDLLVSVISN